VQKEGYPDGFAPDVTVVAGDLRRRDIQLDIPPQPCDMNGDSMLDFDDLSQFTFCLLGPAVAFPEGHFCLAGDADEDLDVDLADFSECQFGYGGP
jgi:hypothetical protein